MSWYDWLVEKGCKFLNWCGCRRKEEPPKITPGMLTTDVEHTLVLPISGLLDAHEWFEREYAPYLAVEGYALHYSSHIICCSTGTRIYYWYEEIK